MVLTHKEYDALVRLRDSHAILIGEYAAMLGDGVTATNEPRSLKVARMVHSVAEEAISHRVLVGRREAVRSSLEGEEEPAPGK